MKISFLSLVSFSLALLATPVSAQTLLERMEGLMPSIVTVRAQNAAVVPGAAKLFINRKTRRGVALRPSASAQYERTGAGVIIDPQGTIVTNAHTIAHAQEISIILNDGTVLPASVRLTLTQEDFAFIQADLPRPMTFISWGDSDEIQLGDEVITVGRSALLNQTISGGRITGLGKSHSEQNQGNQKIEMLLTDINVYQGDSGGPLFDRQGRLIGLMTAQQHSGQHASFAIAVNKIKQVYRQLPQASSP